MKQKHSDNDKPRERLLLRLRPVGERIHRPALHVNEEPLDGYYEVPDHWSSPHIDSEQASNRGSESTLADDQVGKKKLILQNEAPVNNSEAQMVTREFRKMLKHLDRPYSVFGDFYKPSPSNHGYGGPYWWSQNLQQASDWLAEGYTTDEVLDQCWEALNDPYFGPHLYNLWQTRLTLETNTNHLLLNAERAAREWYESLPEQIRLAQIEKLESEIRFIKLLGMNSTSWDFRKKCQQRARRAQEELDRITEEEVPLRSADRNWQRLRLIPVIEKRNTISSPDEWWMDCQVDHRTSERYGLLPVEARILIFELLDRLPADRRSAVGMWYRDQATYREIEAQTGVPRSTAQFWVRQFVDEMADLLENDGESRAA